ncbi:MAG: glycosyltransferase, partial [Bacteroidales bacterium]
FIIKTRKLIDIMKIVSKPKRSIERIKKKRARAVEKANRKAKELEYRLNSLGFVERALEDLHNIVFSKEKLFKKRPAARVLGCWYANQNNIESARRCLDVLAVAKRGEKDQNLLNKTLILEAECHQVLGDNETGKKKIEKALRFSPDADMYLAMANFEPSVTEKLKWINRVLALKGTSEIRYDGSRLYTKDVPGSIKFHSDYDGISLVEAPLITIIMPVYNAETTLETAIKSVLAQTWSNLEVIIVDDCSTDKSGLIIENYCKKDYRIRLIRNKTNSGSFVAKNLALREANGVFVTNHDADDWSHPQKIEKQALQLIRNPGTIGNQSQHIRVTDDLTICRRGTYGLYVLENTSSFMFRREPVMEAIGYWDCVRFHGDVEYIRRIKKVFGDEAVLRLPTGPVSFLRHHESSLTGNNHFGKLGYLMGARKNYLECRKYYHKKAESLYYKFQKPYRPFPLPEPMHPECEAAGSESRHFDVVLATDFRLTDGSTIANVEEIKAQKKAGLRTGLIQMARYDLPSKHNINPKIINLLERDQVEMLVYGEKISCDCLIVKHLPVLQERQIFIPDVDAKSANIIIDQVPFSESGSDRHDASDLKRYQKIFFEYFGQEGTWHPGNPKIRDTLKQKHMEINDWLTLTEEDWVEIINVDDWQRKGRPRKSSKIKVGRHSRDHFSKWPDNRKDLISAYPDCADYEIHILGGAKTPMKLLGQLPGNWIVLPFDWEAPVEFLAKLDVFVYYAHPDRAEAFDRVIIEAMAAGVPVIIPAYLCKYFGDAVIYADYAAVTAAVNKLMIDDDYYQLQVERGQEFVEEHFGYHKHISRIKELRASK